MAAVGRCSFTIEAPAHQTRGRPASPRHAGSRNLESRILGLRLSRAGPAALRAVAGFWATTACPAHADSSRAASRRGGCHGPAGCHCGQQPRDPRLPAGAQGGSRSAPGAWPRLSPIVGTHRWGLAQDRWLCPRRQLLDSHLVVRLPTSRPAAAACRGWGRGRARSSHACPKGCGDTALRAPSLRCHRGHRQERARHHRDAFVNSRPRNQSQGVQPDRRPGQRADFLEGRAHCHRGNLRAVPLGLYLAF